MERKEWLEIYIDDITEEIKCCKKYLSELIIYGSDADCENLAQRIKGMKKELKELKSQQKLEIVRHC